MSIAAIAWAKKQKCGSGTAKAVLMAVADYADEHGHAWPSQKTISDDTEFTDRSVRTAFQALEESGLLKREERRRPDGSRAPDLIILSMSGGLSCAPQQPEAPSGGGEGASGGYRKELPGGGERASGPTTFELPPEPVVVLSERQGTPAPTLAEADSMVETVTAEAIPDGHLLRCDVLAASVCIGWIKSGYDLRQDVIPAVRKALSGRYQITGWRSLTAWVANSHADRMAAEQARPPPEIPPPHSASATVTRLRPRNDPVSTIDIGRSVAARPPPGFA